MHPSNYKYWLKDINSNQTSSVSLLRSFVFGDNWIWDPDANAWRYLNFESSSAEIYLHNVQIDESEARAIYPQAFHPSKIDIKSLPRNRNGYPSISESQFRSMLELSDSFSYLKYAEHHGLFFNFFEVENFIALYQVEHYFKVNNLGVCLVSEHLDRQNINYCCQTYNSMVCQKSEMYGLLSQLLEAHDYKSKYVSESTLWHKVSTLSDECVLRELPVFEQTLFELCQRHGLEMTKNLEYERSYKYKFQITSKRKPGRPRKS